MSKADHESIDIRGAHGHPISMLLPYPHPVFLSFRPTRADHPAPPGEALGDSVFNTFPLTICPTIISSTSPAAYEAIIMGGVPEQAVGPSESRFLMNTLVILTYVYRQPGATRRIKLSRRVGGSVQDVSGNGIEERQ